LTGIYHLKFFEMLRQTYNQLMESHTHLTHNQAE